MNPMLLAYCCQVYVGRATMTAYGMRIILAMGYEIESIGYPDGRGQ